jgi:hypothetical protein
VAAIFASAKRTTFSMPGAPSLYFIKQYPAFSEESHQFAPSFEATVGVRYYKYRSELDSFTAGLFV